MKSKIIKQTMLIGFGIMLCLAFSSGAENAESTASASDDSYIIGCGDTLFITVWKEEALSKQVIVLPDGKISFPLVGEITAAGNTVTELNNALLKKIMRYMPEAVLTVEVQQVNSMLVYIIGKVNNPGKFMLNSQITVMQALAMAGGLNPFADEDDIKIFRKINGEDHIFLFDYEKVSEGKNPEQNIPVKRGDVIVVP